MAFRSVDPTTGEATESFETLGDAELEDRLQRSAVAFRAWRRTTFDERAKVLVRAAEILETEAAAFARTMTREMGKTLRSAEAEAVKCALACRYFAENAAGLLAEERVATEGGSTSVRYEPLGPVLAVMPWNFPFWQVFRFAAPALMAGNTILCKHASNVPRCALEIEDVLHRAGLPRDVYQNLFVDEERVARIVADPRVRAVTLTGSDAAGSAVAATAGRHVKKCVLELGGSDPFIVMPSADMAEAVRTAVIARVQNNGQSCIAAKRFIVHSAVYDRFAADFVAQMAALRIGDPGDPTTELGPLSSLQAAQNLEDQVRRSVRAGATLLCGGSRVEGAGFFFQPTVLADIPEDSPAATEELFGPVAALFRVDDAEAAIRLANDTVYGLAASVWTTDADEAARFIGDLVVGTVFVNGVVASDPRFPFGGAKRSGYGRELGPHGIREFVNVKTVRVWGRLRTDRGNGDRASGPRVPTVPTDTTGRDTRRPPAARTPRSR